MFQFCPYKPNEALSSSALCPSQGTVAGQQWQEGPMAKRREEEEITVTAEQRGLGQCWSSLLLVVRQMVTKEQPDNR